jgi:hypothetical protein
MCRLSQINRHKRCLFCIKCPTSHWCVQSAALVYGC